MHSVRQQRDKHIALHIEVIRSIASSQTDETKTSILSSSISQIRSSIILDRIKIKEVLCIFYERALTVGLQLSALADLNIEYCFQICEQLQKQLDEVPRDERDSKLGMLFGVPISLKDSLMIESKVF